MPARPSQPVSGGVEPAAHHGGDLLAAERLFPDAPKPWIDLSTGISPFAYPIPPIAEDAWARLPQRRDLDALLAAAAQAYGARPGQVVAGAGTQPLMAAIVRLLPPDDVAIVGPTYAEHGRLCRQAGHSVVEVATCDEAAEAARLVILVNPNNPTGEMTPRRDLLALADRLGERGGLLVVDEAFMDSIDERRIALRLGCRQTADRPALLRQILWSGGVEAWFRDCRCGRCPMARSGCRAVASLRSRDHDR